MKYAFITAALAAASMATVVNVEVEGEITGEGQHNGQNHHMSRHHIGRHHHHHRSNGNHWWSDLFNGRRDRHDRNDRRDRHDRNNRRDRSPSRGRNGRYEANDLIDDLFSKNYECILDARDDRDVREDTRRCCEQELGGSLIEQQGRCLLRDVIRNPRDQWRSCALEQRGAQWAECYQRETREIDDKLDGRIPGEDNEHRRHRNDRNQRSHNQHNRNRHGHHSVDLEQFVFGGDDNDRSGKNGRHGWKDRMQCQINMDDEMRRDQINRQCCEEERLGRFDQERNMCMIKGREDAEEFQECAMEQGARDAQCYEERQ